MTDQPQPDRQNGDGLLPCPFCGSKVAQIASNGIGDFFVICRSDDDAIYDCGARTSDVSCETKKGAIDRWNTRAPLPARDGAEGADDEFEYFDLGRSFYEEFTRLSNDGNFKGFICGCSPVEILVHLINERGEALAAPPKPAPDAMRAEDQVQFGRRLHHKPFPLSPPVPPADGAISLAEAFIRLQRRLLAYCKHANAGHMPSDAREFTRRILLGFQSAYEESGITPPVIEPETAAEYMESLRSPPGAGAAEPCRALIKKIDELLHENNCERAHIQLHELAHQFELLYTSNRQTFYTILSSHYPQDATLDIVWQELREAGIVP